MVVFLLSSFSTGSSDTFKQVPNTAYQSGETLKYILYYGFLNGGEASLTVNKSEKHGKNIYHAKAIAKTVGIVDKIYSLYDVYESYFDESTGKPMKAIRNIKEDDYRYYDEVTFDHNQNKIQSTKSGSRVVPANIFDMVSAFYYSRRTLFKNIKINDTIKLNTFFEDEVYPVRVRFVGRETIETKAGKFKALKFIPVVEVGRIFNSEDDMKFWVSDDNNYIPLRVQFDVVISSLKCDLIEYSGIKNSLSKVEK